uniref:Peptidase S1 domain-containing protein n=1 Tax=Parascaris univalens TaxID=6257 RepID=A0A915AMT1_PARUN
MKCTLLLLVVVLVSAEEYEEKPDAIEVIDLPPPHELMEQEVKPRHRACDCNINSVWIDMVFVIDTSRAVSQQDFIAAGNLLRFFFSRMAIDQKLGQYARVGLIFGAEKAYVAANLTTFKTKEEAAQRIKQLMADRKRLPTGSGLQFNVGLALTEAKNILNRESRINRPAMVTLFSATEVTCHRYYSSRQSRIRRIHMEDPCRIATHLTAENNIVATVALKFGKLQRFPKIEIATPCFNITNSINLPGDLLQKICDANCFCPPPYVQYKDDQKCRRYAECLYQHGVALPFQSAADTCSDDEATLVDIFDEDKDQFIKRLHQYGEHTPYWIGLEEHNGEKFWATGRKLHAKDFSNWAPGEPSGKGKCTIADADKGDNSLWSQEKCDNIQSKYFSCQKRACDTSNYCTIVANDNQDTKMLL